MNKWIIKHITNPLWEFGAGRKRLKYLKELEKSQYWPTEKLEELQNYRLKKLISHAYENVPYYHNLFDKQRLKLSDIKTKADLGKIPVLTKDIVAENFQELKAKNISEFESREYSTGGTSGRHLHFINSQKTFDYHMATTYRGWRWMGWDFGERYAYIWGASLDLNDEKKFKSKVRDFLTDNKLLIQAMVFTKKSLKRDCDRLIKFKPKFIMTYPSTLVIIVKYMQSRRLQLKLQGICTTAEKLFPWQRKMFEGFFGCRVTDDYGGRESSIKSIQCEYGNYHISVENGVLETVRNGKSVVGNMGKVLLTEFHNYAMPFIRYENTDVATISNARCKCKRNLPVLEKIEGRTSDIFVTPDGRYLPAEYFMVELMELPGEFYQVIQETKKELIIKIVKGKNFDYKKLGKVKNGLRNWLGKKIKINIQFVSGIPTTTSGKRKYFFSKVKLEF